MYTQVQKTISLWYVLFHKIIGSIDAATACTGRVRTAGFRSLASVLFSPAFWNSIFTASYLRAYRTYEARTPDISLSVCLAVSVSGSLFPALSLCHDWVPRAQKLRCLLHQNQELAEVLSFKNGTGEKNFACRFANCQEFSVSISAFFTVSFTPLLFLPVFF